MMYLLIITFWMNGQLGVDVTRFNTMPECHAAMQAVYQVVPNLNAQCSAVPRGMDVDVLESEVTE